MKGKGAKEFELPIDLSDHFHELRRNEDMNCLELVPKEEEKVLHVGLYTFIAVYTGSLFLGCSITLCILWFCY
jgi:hypothetical protein